MTKLIDGAWGFDDGDIIFSFSKEYNSEKPDYAVSDFPDLNDKICEAIENYFLENLDKLPKRKYLYSRKNND